MNHELYRTYVTILKEELVPAMGCTEPVAVAYAAALARQTLGAVPESVEIKVSANIIKNVKSVVVPHTGGLRGIEAAAAAGIVAGDADAELEVISRVEPRRIPEIEEYLKHAQFAVQSSDSGFIFDIQITVKKGGESAFVQIADEHTNVICIRKNEEIWLNRRTAEQAFAKDAAKMEDIKTEDSKTEDSKTQDTATENTNTDHSLLLVEQIIEFADCVDISDIKETLDRQIAFNTAIAEEGLSGNWGANIGSVLLKAYGDTVHNRAKAYAAAGSDARMSGCEKPVIINSGSGNQGMTASLPVIVYAKELGVSDEMLYRALAVSNLVTIHMKTGIGRLSAYCGATSAGCGAGAGITYLYGGKYREIAHTIVNAVAINSGMICDGAKASCAAKIASAVEAGLLGMHMQMQNEQFYGGDGIVVKGVENTIENIGRLASQGMRQTDEEIIRMMVGINKKDEDK